MCGLPGYCPGDLIDFEFSGDTIEVTFSAGIDRPLKLTSPEATGLLVALRALADIPGVVDPRGGAQRDRQDRGRGGRRRARRDESVAAVDEPAPVESRAAAAVRAAVQDKHALTIDYYSASHDTLTSRVVDPIRVLLIGGHSYLEALVARGRGGSAVPVRPDRRRHASWTSRPPRRNRRCRRRRTPRCSTAIRRCRRRSCGWRPSAAWMFEYYPMREVRELPDGSCEAVMTYASEDWMTRLVLGFGSAVRVLGPESLAQRVRDAAARPAV